MRLRLFTLTTEESLGVGQGPNPLTLVGQLQRPAHCDNLTGYPVNLYRAATISGHCVAARMVAVFVCLEFGMRREQKVLDFKVTKVADREVTGIFSVFGNDDDYNDRIWPGAFTKTIQERQGKILHLWQHDFNSPPIAVIKSLREVSRDELPSDVLAAAPMALGGAEVVREYLDTARANEVLTAIKAGAPLQMSFAFDAIRYDFEQLEGAKYEWERRRNLREVRLHETSDVLWGANSATVASKASLPFDYVLRQLMIHLEELKADSKAGRRNSTSDQERIDTIATLAVELGAVSVKLADAEPPADTEDDSSKSSDASSRAAESSAPTALSYQKRLQLAERALKLVPTGQRV